MFGVTFSVIDAVCLMHEFILFNMFYWPRSVYSCRAKAINPVRGDLMCLCLWTGSSERNDLNGTGLAVLYLGHSK